MRKLMEKRPILHAVLWIILYIVVVNAGDALSEAAGAPYMTGILLIFLSAALLFYLRKNQRLAEYGLCRVTGQDARRVLFYIPLIVLAFIQLLEGVSRTVTAADVAVACLLMIGTGFIEEVLFRGFLYQGIRRRRGVAPAVLISGITFGLGHIVNLLRGYTSAAQAEQIVLAIAIGIALAMLVAVARSLIPGILFHIMYNITGTIGASDRIRSLHLLLAIFVIAALYALFLIRFLPKKEKAVQAGTTR